MRYDANETINRPGKFQGESILTPVLWTASLDGWDTESAENACLIDDVPELFTGDPRPYSTGDPELDEMIGREWQNLPAAAILYESSDGFVSAVFYDSNAEARQGWQVILDEMDEDFDSLYGPCGSDGQHDGLTISGE